MVSKHKKVFDASMAAILDNLKMVTLITSEQNNVIHIIQIFSELMLLER